MKTCSLILILFFSLCSFKGIDKISGPGPEPTPVNKALLLQLINNARKQGRQCGDNFFNAAPALTWNDQLEKAAVEHSNDMNANNYFNHIAPDGSGTPDRMEKAGYNWRNYGENIGMGYQSEKEVVEGWLNSPGHCKNIMNPAFREMAVARQGKYWTQVFGSRK